MRYFEDGDAINLGKKQVILAESVVTDLALDWIQQNLYYVANDKLFVMSLETWHSKKIRDFTQGVENTNLAVDPRNNHR